MMGDPMKRAMIQMQGIFAELDKNMLVAKLQKARDRIKSEGRKPGSPKYSSDPQENKRCEGRRPYGTANDLEKQTLAYIQALTRRHWLPSQIAKELNETGHATRHGKTWHCATISKILRRSA